jgi:4-hydroxybenzoate polyprenyltransferase/geranylgeranylglycerol-phosphate geranylgeranyltransferase
MSWRVSAMAHVETWRPYTSCYVGLVGLAGGCLASSHPDGWRLLAAWAIPTLGWLAGLYGGDYFDRELDAISKPQRPIPSGRLAPGTALGAMIAIIGGAAIWTVLVNWHALIIVACATAVGLSYNGFFKARGLSGNLVRGSLISFAFLFGAWLNGGGIGLTLVCVALVFALQDSGSNLVGALRDIDGDRAGGYLTYPVRHGVTPAVRVVAGLVAGWAVLGLVTVTIAAPRDRLWCVLPLTAAIVMAASVVIRLYGSRDTLTRAFALHMHEVLCLERIVLAAALIAWGAGPAAAIGASVPALTVTWLSQVKLRARHEFSTPPVPAASAAELAQ